MKKKEENLPSLIGPYSIMGSLGKGGMGEVYLAKDPFCGRKVALKRIRPELKDNRVIQSRFLREAKVASALSHPSIVPILSIQSSPPDVYYTMPYVEGETLRQILKGAKSISRSIPALARIFLQVCEAVAYTHSKGILHRDLKPENIIVGKYGEVMILDWGIADFIDQIGKEKPLPAKKIPGEDLTKPGKITGTLAYMAPERLTGTSSSVQTDIYALGIILYQMLTLQLPFQRKTIAAFRKSADLEELVDPIEMAPYRDIPHQLAAVCHKCLAKSIEERFQSVEEFILEIKNFIEGRPEWILTAQLDLKRKEDWQFQENMLLAKHIAITRSLDVTEWAALMVSRATFAINCRLDAAVKLGKTGQGLGLLLSVPETTEGKMLEEGYCLWIGSEKHPACQLFRNNVQVMEAKSLCLQPDTWHDIRIEKVDDHLRFYLDGALKLSFASHLPLPAAHVGLLHKDGDFEIKNLKVFDGSHNVMVGCLAVPNSFLSHKFYDLALQEYRRIGQCFPGRMEGREALFRAGLTLLEKAKIEKGKSEREKLFSLALKEFEKLYRTPGAPLEYLGKSLVYEALGDAQEEAKCLELALRKFPKHPLLPMLKEHIVYRIHESSLNDRESAYRIILLAIRHIPDLLENPDTLSLIESLEKNWETLPFFEKSQDRPTQIAIQLAFWLNNAPILAEIAEAPIDNISLGNALFCLLELNADLKAFAHPLEIQSLAEPLPKKLTFNQARSLYYLLQEALTKDLDLFESTFKKLDTRFLPARPYFDALGAWCYLLQKKYAEASLLFEKYPATTLNQEASPLHFPYGVYLYLTEGAKWGQRHFSLALDTPYPPTTALPSLFLTHRIDDKKGWIQRAFWWEKKELHRQLELFYKTVGKPE